MNNCSHKHTECLNPYELIRKYKCETCHEVMMCACDKSIGTRYLSHQLSTGTVLETQEDVIVTLGFQSHICCECRGLMPKAFPTSETFGRTSKIKRYYWRELHFKGLELFGELSPDENINPIFSTSPEIKALYEKAQQQALAEIKELHKTSPKYSYSEKSQQEVFEEYKVPVIDLDATYIKNPATKKVGVSLGETSVSVEEFVQDHFAKEGFESLHLESRPFHVLFGVFMWLLIQAPSDPKNRMVGFGERSAFEKDGSKHPIYTSLPDDFGTSGYFKRRKKPIHKHLASLETSTEEFEWLFDYWLEYSYGLRQYLWAHKNEDIEKARKIIGILPNQIVVNILKYLVKNYWGHYLGWPDLLVHKEDQFLFVEVKSSGDTLSEDQKHWIKNNFSALKLPYKVVKVHKEREILL
ncbi:MAG: VRR-NUC domain-containing protein [Cytophagales bacterium]